MVFSEVAPDAVGLADGESVVGTLAYYWAACADGSGRSFARRTRGTALAFGVKEEVRILAAARSFELPIPSVCIRPGES